jgi:hypothetical protein
MREQDGAYVPDRGARLMQSLLDPPGPARQTRVDEHHAVVDHHEMSVDEQDPDFEDTLGDFPHHSTLARYGWQAHGLTWRRSVTLGGASRREASVSSTSILIQATEPALNLGVDLYQMTALLLIYIATDVLRPLRALWVLGVRQVSEHRRHTTASTRGPGVTQLITPEPDASLANLRGVYVGVRPRHSPGTVILTCPAVAGSV